MPPRRGGSPKRSVALVALPVLSPEQVEDYTDVEKRAEALVLSLRGYTHPQIADRFGVHRNSVGNWLKRAAREYRSRIEDADAELGKVVATIDQVIIEAWKAHEIVDKDMLSGANYLRLILDAAVRKAALLGFDQPSRQPHKGPTEVVIEIGGEQAVRVGVRS